MRSLPAGTESHPKLCLQKCQKDIDVLSMQLTGIMGDILALPGEDTAQVTNTMVIQGSLSELNFEAGRRLLLLEASAPNGSEAPLEPTMELPKISVQTFLRRCTDLGLILGTT